MNKFLMALAMSAAVMCGCGEKSAPDAGSTETAGGAKGTIGQADTESVGGTKATSAKPSTDSLLGTWTIDLDKVVEEAMVVASTEMEKSLADLKGPELEMAKAMMPTGDKLAEIMKAQFAKAKVELTFKADGTCTMTAHGMGENMDGTGTWTRDGEVIVVTPVTKNGEPVEGDEAETKELRFRGGKLSMQPEEGAPTFYFTRK